MESRVMSGVEIERKYLLRSLPPMPAARVETLRIEQGYLDPPTAVDFPSPGEPVREGRIRRTIHSDGRVVCHHTIKSGLGLIREEREREIEIREFERLWPRTAGQRLAKLRHCVRSEDGLTWEVDEILHPVQLVLAEVELPDASAAAQPPEWLSPIIDREVTDDPSYNNRAIARRGRGDSH